MKQALKRFLGVEESADARTMLGITDANPPITQIDAALRAQIGRVHRHPDGNSRDGEWVRQRLRDAADELKAKTIQVKRDAGTKSPDVVKKFDKPKLLKRPAPMRKTVQGKPSRPTLALTDFDRAALAVMVGSGGWNAESRARLVSLASIYGIGVQGLMRVIGGLSDYARHGGAHLGVADIAGPTPSMPAMRPPMRRSAEIDATSDVLSRLLPELREDTLWSRMKVIVLFSIVTLMAVIVMARLLFSPQNRKQADESVVAAVGVDNGADNSTTTVVPAASIKTTRTSGPAAFVDPPTFLGSGVPMAVADAADECANLAGQFDEIARKVAIAEEPSEAVYRNWEVSLRTIATGWLLADDATRETIEKLILYVLFAAAQQPSVSDRMLGYLIPISGPPADPVDLVRGAWTAGMLGRISASNLPSVVTIKADDLLHVAIEPESPEQAKSASASAQRWLDRAMPSLVERTSYDARALDYWELWISTLRKVTTQQRQSVANKQRFDESILRAARLLMEQPSDLAVGSLPTNIIGRLFSMIDINTSEPMRREVLALFENDAVSPPDLWIITSMLVKFRDAPWMSRELVLPRDADIVFRRRVMDRWQKQWPEPSSSMMAVQRDASGAALVDKSLLEDWSQLLDELAQQIKDPSDAKSLTRLVQISRLNEAAGALLAQDVAAAESILRSVSESLLSETSDGRRGNNNRNSPGAPAGTGRPTVTTPQSAPSPISVASRANRPGANPAAQQPRRVGQPLGQDGMWAAEYANAMRNSAEKLNLLSALRNSAGTDLGPIDSIVFVGEVYRGTPEEVRELAQTVAVDRFSSGPNVARELLDQFFEAPLSTRTAECISGFTRRVLPAVRAPSWKVDARRALVEHRLELGAQDDSDIDLLTIDLTESYVRRLQRVSRGSALMSTPPSSAGDAAEELRSVWNRYASVLIATAPTPADLPSLARRHEVRARLARGPVQQFIAGQVGVLEILSYVTTAEKPPMRDTVMILLNESAAKRDRALYSLDQAIEAELAMARVWGVRMGRAPAVSNATKAGVSP